VGAQVDDEVTRRKRTIAPPQLGDPDGTRQIVVTAAFLTGAVRVSDGVVHPSAIGAATPILD